MSELNHKGFYFECYDRDQIIAGERRNTTQFLKDTQIPLEQQKKQEEQQYLREAPSNLITTDQLQKMREAAMQQALEEKNMLKQTFSSQYNDKIYSKQEAERREKE